MPAQFTADLNPKNTNQMSLGDLMKIGLYSAETEIANRKAQVAAEQQRELPLIQSIMADPENKLSDGSYDLKKITQILPAVAPLTGPEYATKLVTMTKNHIDASKAANDLSQQERGIIGSVYAAHAAAGTQDPNAIIASLNALRTENPNLDRLVSLKIDALKQIPGGPEFNKKLYQARNEILTPTQVIDQFAPKATTGTVGGQTVGMITQPSIRGEQPSVSTAPLGGGQPSQPGGGAAPAPAPAPVGTSSAEKSMPKLIQEDTSMNYTGPANPLNLNKYQDEAYAKGKTNVTEANMSVKSIKDLQQSIRKVEEFMSSASGSGLVQKLQAGGKWAWGNPELDSLVKNIAQVQARNASIMGLDKTDASRDLNAKLSGSEKIDTQALAGVMQQVKAETKAAELYTAGLNKFVEKRGDVNGYIQQQKFQNKWAEHYDPRIFQVDDIAGNVRLSEPEKEAKIKDITGRMSKDEFAKYKEDRLIIHRLAKGLYQ